HTAPPPPPDKATQASAAQSTAIRDYEDGQYASALEHFQEAYRLRPESSLLLGIARSRYRLKQLDAAKSCLFDFLNKDSKSVYAGEAFELLTRIDKETANPLVGQAQPCLDERKPSPEERKQPNATSVTDRQTP